MNTFQNAYMSLPGITAEELSFLQQATNGLDENQKKNFFTVYSGRRRNPQDVLLFALLGFVGVAGVHRFVLGQIGMGILYFFTGGLCLVGTVIDIINHKSLALEYNRQMAYDSHNIVQPGMFWNQG